LGLSLRAGGFILPVNLRLTISDFEFVYRDGQENSGILYEVFCNMGGSLRDNRVFVAKAVRLNKRSNGLVLRSYNVRNRGGIRTGRF